MSLFFVCVINMLALVFHKFRAKIINTIFYKKNLKLLNLSDQINIYLSE